MSQNRGKDFEGVIKDCLLKVPDIDVQRLYDTTNGFAGVKQPSDFSVYLFPYKYYLECKSTNQHTLNRSAISQLDALHEKSKIKGVTAGVFIWYIQDDLTVFIPVETLYEHFYTRDKKSVAVKDIISKDLQKSGKYYVLKGEKKRVFWNYDMQDFFKNFRFGDM